MRSNKREENGTHSSCRSIFSNTLAHLHLGMHSAYRPKHPKGTNPICQEQEPNVDTFQLNAKQYLLWQQGRENIEQKGGLIIVRLYM